MADVTNQFYEGEAFIGYGAQFMVGQDDGSPETFVAMPDVNRIVPGDMTTGVVDKTHLRSPGRHREKLATLRDSGEITVEANYRPGHGAHKQSGGDGFSATHSVVSLWRNVTDANFLLLLPDASGMAGSPGSPDAGEGILIRGTVTKYQIGEIGLDGKVPVTIGITPLRDYSDGLPA